LGFGIKIMPGVRVRASSRGIGIGASLGPLSMSTGVGFGSGLGVLDLLFGGSGGGAPAGRSAAAAHRQAREARKAEELEEWDRLAELHDSMISVHLADFPPARRPIAPRAKPLDEAGIRRKFEKDAVSGISVWKRSERREARLRAASVADEEIAKRRQKQNDDHGQAQQVLEYWGKLISNDPSTVLGTLEHAFEDNAAPATPLNSEGSHVTIAMLVGLVEDLPDKMANVTDAGNLSIRK
jgi:hypothetical protein